MLHLDGQFTILHVLRNNGIQNPFGFINIPYSDRANEAELNIERIIVGVAFQLSIRKPQNPFAIHMLSIL
ncbi:hypothetical protein D3C84_1158170 [compost metagenome]